MTRTRTRRTDGLGHQLTVVVLSMALMVTLAPPADAATTSSLYNISNSEDNFYNYDFNGEVSAYDNVDWAVDLIFFNNAEIDKVKDSFSGFLPVTSNNGKNAVVNDGGGYQYDSDGGKKVSQCPPAEEWFLHYRVYADGDDRLYNTNYGYYVIGTAHADYNDGCQYPEAGFSEWTEDNLAYWASQVWPGGVYSDYGWMYNPESYRLETSDGRPHHWDNNGYATYVNVP